MMNENLIRKIENQDPIRAYIPVSVREEKAAKLRLSGKVLREVADEMGISSSQTWNLLRRYYEKTGDHAVLRRYGRVTDEQILANRKARHLRAVQAYTMRHPERVKARRKKWEMKNTDARREYNRNWKKNNPERYRKTINDWRSNPFTRIKLLCYSRIADSKCRSISYDESALLELCNGPLRNCALCECELDYSNGTGKSPQGPSIDRVHPELGYIKNNVAILCNQCNTLKGGGTAKFHRGVVDFMDRHLLGV